MAIVQLVIVALMYPAVTAAGAYNTYTLFRDQPIDWSNAPQAAFILALGAFSAAIALGPTVALAVLAFGAGH